MPCSACRKAKERRKAALELRRKRDAERQAERIRRQAEAQAKLKFTDINGAP